MKKLFVLLILFLASLLGSFAISTPQLTFSQNEIYERAALEPTVLFVPALELEVAIEEVGEDVEGRMAVPVEVGNAGWWSRGTKPGQVGSAVIAGHIDTPDGKPGIFYRLQELNIGDEIIVTDRQNQKFTFVVTKKETFDDASFPLDLVFNDKSGRLLNLITCFGDYNHVTQNYTDRFVVFSELKSL